MKFTQLNHLKELLTLTTIMVLLRLMTKIGTGSTTMTQLVKFVTFNLLRMKTENWSLGKSPIPGHHAARSLMDGHMLQSLTTTKAINSVLQLKVEKLGISILMMKFSILLMKRKIMTTRFMELNLLRAILIMTMSTLCLRLSPHLTSGSIFMTQMVKFAIYKPTSPMMEQF